MSVLTRSQYVPGDDRPCRPRRSGRTAWLSLIALLLIAALAGVSATSRTARAQAKTDSKGSDPAKTADDKTARDVQALVDEVDEIDMLRSINPLKLTPDQIDSLVKAITDAKTDYEKKLTELTKDAGPGQILKMADDIHAQHKDALAGKSVPKEFDDRIKKIQSDFTEKRDKLNTDNIVRMSDACNKILSTTQISKAVTLEKDILAKLKRFNPENKDSQFFNQYVVDVFISYPRIVPLLKELKEVAPKN